MSTTVLSWMPVSLPGPSAKVKAEANDEVDAKAAIEENAEDDDAQSSRFDFINAKFTKNSQSTEHQGRRKHWEDFDVIAI